MAAITPKKKILILTADAGFGHRSAANAILEALEEKYSDQLAVEIANPLDEKTAPPFLHDQQADYDKWVRNIPEIYNLGFQASDSLIPTRILEQWLVMLLKETMRDLMIKHKPDVVVTTYPHYHSSVSALFSKKKYRIPFFTVVTDLSTVHRLWFHRKVTSCLVPNKLVAELAMSYGFSPNKISITGIPVSPSIVREIRSKDEIRAELGWQPGIPTLLAVGSKRVDRLIDTLNVVNHFGCALQVAVVAGKDEDLYNEITQFEWHIPAYVYDYVENMPAMMKASDLIICKAGGLIVTESLASGLPMVLIEVIPGQETGNAEYVTAYGAADMAETPIEVLELLSHLMRDDGALLKKRAQNAQLMGLPRSAYDAAAIIAKAAETVEAKKRTRRPRQHTVEGHSVETKAKIFPFFDVLLQ